MRTNLLRAIKIMLSLLMYYSGFVAFVRTLLGQAGIRILAYHRVGNAENDYLNMCISIRDFEMQMEYLSKHYRAIDLSKAVHLLQNGDNIRRNTIVLTFDDGYKDNHTNAFPIVKKYGLPVTIFLTVEPIRSGQPLWYDIIAECIRNTSKREVDLSHYGMGLVTLKDSSERWTAVRKVVPRIKVMTTAQRRDFMVFLSQELQVKTNVQNAGRAERQMLSWSEIRELKCHGVAFGAHTINHPSLMGIPIQEAESEVRNSKHTIEEELGDPIDSFAYPFGGPEDFDDDMVRIIKKSGFLCACSLIAGVVKRGNDEFALKRIVVDRDFVSRSMFISKALFATEMAGIFDIIFMRFMRK